MCIKTVLAFLNSALFQFMYAKMFGEVKILKGNLIELPFPMISKEEDSVFEELVDSVLSGDKSAITEIDNSIFQFYHLSEEQIKCLRSSIKWKN